MFYRDIPTVTRLVPLQQIKREGPRLRIFILTLSTTKKIKDLDRPQAIAAAILTSFLLLLLSHNYPDLSLINA